MVEFSFSLKASKTVIMPAFVFPELRTFNFKDFIFDKILFFPARHIFEMY